MLLLVLHESDFYVVTVLLTTLYVYENDDDSGVVSERGWGWRPLWLWVSDSCDEGGARVPESLVARFMYTLSRTPKVGGFVIYFIYIICIGARYVTDSGTYNTRAHKHIVRICLCLIVRVISFVWSCGWGRTRTLCKELCVVFCLTWRHDVTPGTRRVSDKWQRETRERDTLTQLTHLLEQSQDIVVRGGTTTVVAARTARWRCV